MADPDSDPHPLSRPLKSRAAPWTVLAISLVVTIIVAFSTRSELKRQDRARYERLKERVLAAIDGRFHAAEQAMYGARALVGPSGELSDTQWARYVDSIWPF